MSVFIRTHSVSASLVCAITSPVAGYKETEMDHLSFYEFRYVLSGHSVDDNKLVILGLVTMIDCQENKSKHC